MRFTDPNGRNATAFIGGLFVESWHGITGQGFNGSRLVGALKDGYNGQGAGFTSALLQDVGTASAVLGVAGAIKGASALVGRAVAKKAIGEAVKLGTKGLGNSFKGKTPSHIGKMFKSKGFKPRGPNPVGGKGGYVNPKTGRSYHIDPKPQVFKKTGVEKPHVDVNRLRDYRGILEKKKYPLE